MHVLANCDFAKEIWGLVGIVRTVLLLMLKGVSSDLLHCHYCALGFVERTLL